MPEKKLFEAVNKNINKFEVRLENYIIPSLQTDKLNKKYAEEASLTVKITSSGSRSKQLLKTSKEQLSTKVQERTSKVEEVNEEEPNKLQKNSKSQNLDKSTKDSTEQNALRERSATAERYAVFSEKQETEQAKLCMWLYMPEQSVECLLLLTSTRKIRETIDNKMKLEYPKGVSRILAIELMYSVVRFCQKCRFNTAQTGTLLSLFYLTHQYFLSSFYTTAEKTYQFFTEYMLLHCLDCPPDSMELFNYKESTHVVQYFCTLYLRNLPLIRLLTLPNFAFYLNYEKQPDPFEYMAKKGKGKKDKNTKGGKKR